MTTVPTPSVVLHREEWTDDDFDIPEGHPIVASDADSDKDEDWDAEMNLGQTGGARVDLGMSAAPQTSSLTLGAKSGFIPFAALATTISAPLPRAPSSQRLSDDEFEEDEGVSTIKLSSGPTIVGSPRTPLRANQSLAEDDDDLEDDFALPSDLSQLSLRPLEPHHPSKAILEWGDKDQASSSTYSSDAYSNLGLGIGASPSSFGTSTSQPETETEDDDDEGILDGLIVPAGLFETGKGGKELARLIELRKNMPTVDERVRIASPEEDDFELGLLIEDDVDLSPSRLLNTQKKQSTLPKSVPPRVAARPPSRLRNELGTQHNARAQTTDTSNRRNTRSPTLVRPRPPSRGQNSAPPVSLKRSEAQLAAASSHHMPRSHTSVGLRSQKSHGVLNPPPGPPRASLARKASLSTLLDRNSEPSTSNVASSSGTTATRGGHLAAPTLPKSASSMALNRGYDSSTAASRARTQAAQFPTSSRIHSPEFRVPPTRPSTPSSNPAALRLTMPTASSRLKSRPSVSSVFSPTTPNTVTGPSVAPQSAGSGRGSTSPSPHARPPSAAERPLRAQPSLGVARPLRKPKRAKVYGDGTELDKFEDLPTDREKERKYRVPPKGAAALLPLPPPSLRTSPSSGATSKRVGRESGGSVSGSEPSKSSTSTLRRVAPARKPDSPTRRARSGTVTNLGNRKPTLIRNLGGSNAPKVVGDMKWNPSTLRWEGNEQALRDFDATVGTSTRPALITQLTGSSIGSPIGAFAGGARVVGNMIFDPTQMCWISRLPPEEEEPDVFADMADDEDDEFEEGRGGTIRINQPSTSYPQTPSTRTSTRGETPSPATSSRHSRAFSDISDGEYLGHGSSAPALGGLNQQLIEAARAAESRHRAEMKGWVAPTQAASAPVPVRPPSRQHLNNVDPDRDHLWFIRAVATRNYEASS